MNEEQLENVKIEFGMKVKSLRLQKGMTQLDLAAKAGIDVRQIKRIESAQTNTSITVAVSLSKALEIQIAQLFN